MTEVLLTDDLGEIIDTYDDADLTDLPEWTTELMTDNDG